MIKQRTLKGLVETTGIGVHTGKKISIALRPAPVDTGIVFRRVDLECPVELPATVSNVGSTVMSTCLAKGEVKVATIEHLMAAFAGLGIDNVYVDLDAAEVPVMDGSAEPFVFLIGAAGIEEQPVPKKLFRIKRKVKVTDGDKWAAVEPYQGFKASFTMNFDHPVFRKVPQTVEVDLSRYSFVKELSRARTFGMLADYEYFRANNLALGSSLDNTVVIDDFRVLNEDGLRYPDEFARHKVLDAVGDLYTLGLGMLGAFSGYKSGHTLNNLLLKELLATQKAWELVTLDDQRGGDKLPIVFPAWNLIIKPY
jgi:UDP-3-0-acyl N-acetylglucosamine deacetylase